MGPESQRELQDLIAVNEFYRSVLERHLGHAVPIAAEVRELSGSPADIEKSSEPLKLWLDLLDMAITPPMVRDALKQSQGVSTAHSLLRYFVAKASARAGDRDKTDCVITHLFRTPDPESVKKWERPDTDVSYYHLAQAAAAFQGEVHRALEGVHFDPVPSENAALLREFEYFYQEVEEFRHFDQVTDSAIVQRVRELKQSLGKSFYHPEAMATIAVWNDVFGRKFDDLFHEATKQIKTFAEHVQREGASIMSRVEGDITVKHLTEIETNQILVEDYQNAQDQFRKVSKYKKAVDSKRIGRPAYAPIPPRVPIPAAAPSAAPVPAIPTIGFHEHPSSPAKPPAAPPSPAPAAQAEGSKGNPEVLAVPPSQAVQNAVHEGKLASAREMIKSHVRTANSKFAHIVPIKNSKIALTPAELEAFRADYGGEKSFRADYVNIMMTLVTYLTRMMVEVDEYNQKANSAYLWKPHADALSYLLSTLERISMEAEQVKTVARGRGLQDKAGALEVSLEKLRTYARTVSSTLQAAKTF